MLRMFAILLFLSPLFAFGPASQGGDEERVFPDGSVYKLYRCKTDRQRDEVVAWGVSRWDKAERKERHEWDIHSGRGDRPPWVIFEQEQVSGGGDVSPASFQQGFETSDPVRSISTSCEVVEELTKSDLRAFFPLTPPQPLSELKYSLQADDGSVGFMGNPPGLEGADESVESTGLVLEGLMYVYTRTGLNILAEKDPESAKAIMASLSARIPDLVMDESGELLTREEGKRYYVECMVLNARAFGEGRFNQYRPERKKYWERIWGDETDELKSSEARRLRPKEFKEPREEFFYAINYCTEDT